MPTITRTTIATVLTLIAVTGLVRAQYSSDVFSLKKAEDLYDERGFQQGKAVSVDGKLVVTESNGNVSYSYPIAKYAMQGYHFETVLNYCGSVGFTTFQKYVIAHDDDNGGTSPYGGWSKFHQNRPAWIVGVNGFAVQVLSTTTHFHNRATGRLNSTDPVYNDFDDGDFIWCVDGYDFCNRMVDFNALASGDVNGGTYVDNIRLLRADGGVLELVNATQRNETSPDFRPEVFTGYYVPSEANARAFAVVEFDSTYWMQHLVSRLIGMTESEYNPVTPRVVHYYPGDGLEYVFREWIIPYGTQPYFGVVEWGGGYYGGPTIFYLEEINGAAGRIITFDRSRHYPVVPGLNQGVGDDTTRGHALATILFEAAHSFAYGINSMTIEAFGRTTKVRFGTVMPSGTGTETNWMPIAQNGYIGGGAEVIANYPESEDDLYKSYVGYVTEIIDPEGRKTEFSYEPYERHYVNFGFPHASGGTDVTVSLRNYRLHEITESGARYTIEYFKKACDLSYVPGINDNLYVTGGGVGDTLSMTTSTMNDAAKVNNVAAIVRKYDKSNTLLITDRYRFDYASNSTVTDYSTHTQIDNLALDTVTTDFAYKRYTLPALAPKLPAPIFTAPWQTTTTAAGVVTTTETQFSVGTSTTSASAWGSTYSSVIATPWGTPYLILDTATKTWVNSVLKSSESYVYTVDTVRPYGADETLRRLFGLDMTSRTTITRNPLTGDVLTSSRVDYTHLPIRDTVATVILRYYNKIAAMQMYDSLRHNDPAYFHVHWEQVMYLPPIAQFTYDTVTMQVRPPQFFGLERRTTVRDAADSILLIKANELQDVHDPGDPTSFMLYGLTLSDSVYGAGGLDGVRLAGYEYDLRRPVVIENGNGARSYQSFSGDYVFSGDSIPPGGLPPLTGAKLDNLDSVTQQELRGDLYGNPTEEPMATRRLVRTFAGGGALDSIRLHEYLERSYFSQVSATRDVNGWYSRTDFDADGRLRTLWLPGDFQNPDSVFADTVSGRDSAEGYGTTVYTAWHDWQICDIDYQPPENPYSQTHYAWGSLYADYPVVNVPGCPSCGESHDKHEGQRMQGTCHTPIPYSWQTPAQGTAGFYVLPPQVVEILSLDSAYLRFFVTSAMGDCITLTVSVPALSVTNTYLFNCDDSTDAYSAGDYLTIDLTDVKNELIGYSPGDVLGVTFDVSTPGGRVQFASGFDGADVRPELFLQGTFRKINEISDHTLAYHYDDDSLIVEVNAKVDDSLHSANLGQWNPLQDIARRDTLRHYIGADGRVLHSEAIVLEDDGTVRTDVSTYLYTGLGKRTMVKDPESDSVRTRYDALGRPIEQINADSTITRIAYYTGAPSDFGLSDSAYFGFCSATITTDENREKFATYFDAFDRKRLEIANDSGVLGVWPVNIPTYYDYDVLGRLTVVIDANSDTTRYTYDAFGRVKYKNRPDIGTVSYAYDKLGNLRFSQTQEEVNHRLVTFNEYDDLNRIVLIGQAAFSETYDEDVLNASVDSLRYTDGLDPNRLHTDEEGSIVTANKTLWDSPEKDIPSFSYDWSAVECEQMPRDTVMLGETEAPVGPLLMRPTQFYNSSAGIEADTADFENIALHPEFPRLVVAYDTMPAVQGAVWSNFPDTSEWNKLAPKGAVRNQLGREAAVAYRERGCEPFHYSVLSYDERGRVEALLRYTENLGFDAVYYTYNSMNQVVSVRTGDLLRHYTTWYGMDRQGRVDSVWTYLSELTGGLYDAGGIHYRGMPERPEDADIVYHYTKTGRVDSMRYPPANVLVTYAYNHRKWLDSMVATHSSVNLFRDVLTYSRIGLVTEQQWQHDSSTRWRQRYHYDSLQRLNRWVHGPVTSMFPTDTLSYTYDNIGNRQFSYKGPDPFESYDYFSGTSLLRLYVTAPMLGNHIATQYGYNGNGAMTFRWRSFQDVNTLGWAGDISTEELGYSFRDLVQRYRQRDSLYTLVSDWRYRYSAGGEREQKRLYEGTQSDAETTYPWVYYLLGGTKEQLAVYHGRQTSDTICGDTGRRAYVYPVEYLSYGVLRTSNVKHAMGAGKQYVIADHLGSVRATLDSAGNVLGHRDFQPFGSPIAVAGEATRKSFIDHETDLESGLDNFGARGYDPMTGRFMSVDPLWEKSPQTSPFAYSANQPCSAKDPSGLFWITDHLAIDHAAYVAVYGPIVGEAIYTATAPSTLLIESAGFSTNSLHLDNMSNERMSAFLADGGYCKLMNHTLQDFYAHSNYVEIMKENGYADDDIPLFDELTPGSDIYNTVMAKIETTKYKDEGQPNGHDGGILGGYEKLASGEVPASAYTSSSNFIAKDANGLDEYKGFVHPSHRLVMRLAFRATVKLLKKEACSGGDGVEGP